MVANCPRLTLCSWQVLIGLSTQATWPAALGAHGALGYWNLVNQLQLALKTATAASRWRRNTQAQCLAQLRVYMATDREN